MTGIFRGSAPPQSWGGRPEASTAASGDRERSEVYAPLPALVPVGAAANGNPVCTEVVVVDRCRVVGVRVGDRRAFMPEFLV